MSKTLTESATFSPSIVVPENGIDLRDATQLETGVFQPLTNRARYLHDRQATLNARQVSAKRISYPAPNPQDVDNEWGLSGSQANGTRWAVQGTPNVSHPYLWFPLPGLIATYRINLIEIFLRGASQHVCNSPPQVSLMQLHSGVTTVATFVGTAGVDDTNAAGYDSFHKLAVGGLSNHEIAEDAVYYLRVKGESDTGAVSGLELWGARVNMLVPAAWGTLP